MQEYLTCAFKVRGHPDQTKFGCVSWAERGMDPARSVPPWARDPSGVLSAAILPLSSLEVMCRIKLSGGTLRTEWVLEGVISLVSTRAGGGWGLVLLWVRSRAWESCLIDVADLFVVGFRNIFFCLLPHSISSLKFRFWEWGSWLYTGVYEIGLVLFGRLLGKGIDFLPALYEDVNNAPQTWPSFLLTTAPEEESYLDPAFAGVK